ncbi:hypothetical protein ABK040_014274 [Willaertia magna]
MSDFTNPNLMEEYRKIADRLKKRMFRKIPYDQISEQYVNFGFHLLRNGQTHYTALSMLAAANCEKQNKTPLNAAFFYIYSGRIFTEQACKEKTIEYFTMEEFVIEAIEAFREAIEIYDSKQMFTMCSSLCYELANTLKQLEKFSESSHYYTKCYFYCVKKGKYEEIQNSDSSTINNSDNNLQNNQLFNLSLNRETSHSMELDALSKAIECLLEIKDFEMAILRIKIFITILEERIDTLQQLLKNQEENLNNNTNLNNNNTINNTIHHISTINNSFIYQWMNAQFTLLFVLLLQKKKEEASEVLQNILLGNESGWIAKEFGFIYENVIPIIQALHDSCLQDNINEMDQLISQELQSCVNEQQFMILQLLKQAYENPLFIDILENKEK